MLKITKYKKGVNRETGLLVHSVQLSSLVKGEQRGVTISAVDPKRKRSITLELNAELVGHVIAATEGKRFFDLIGQMCGKGVPSNAELALKALRKQGVINDEQIESAFDSVFSGQED